MKPIFSGLAAGTSLLAMYALTMTILNGWQAAVEQFGALWYLMLPIAIGFGVQVGLFTKLKGAEACYHVTVHDSKGREALSVSGGSASVGMLACCAHHVSEILPIIGLSGVSLFLVQYQIPILAASFLVNIFGIFIMLGHFRKLKLHGLTPVGSPNTSAGAKVPPKPRLWRGVGGIKNPTNSSGRLIL